MSIIENLRNQVCITRREIKNVRQELFRCKAEFGSEFKKIQLLLQEPFTQNGKVILKDKIDGSFKMVPIGFISSCFKNKNGIPRQPSLCKVAKATLDINKTFFTNPEHSLIGLSQFSYIWILFVFNKNDASSVKAKVHPPRLNGKSVGVFSTRSPHRPCPIGLSLVKLDKIIGHTLFLSGVDMLDGTPVLDIKPYIPSYDIPVSSKYIESVAALSLNDKVLSSGSATLEEESTLINNKNVICINCKDFNDGLQKSVPTESADENSSVVTNIGSLLTMSPHLDVVFTLRANQDIEKFHASNEHEQKCEYCLNFITGFSEAKIAIQEILQNDPRSVYRRTKCTDKLYFFEVDSMHITCWFDDVIAEVLKVKPVVRKIK